MEFGKMAVDWQQALAPEADRLGQIEQFLQSESRQGRGYLPDSQRILRAFQAPLEHVRVVILGQDPYPTPGHATGLAFGVGPSVHPLPPTLRNILREYQADLALPEPASGDLSPWSQRGVLLLNRVLTVSPGVSRSHRGRGWEGFTTMAIRALASRGTPLVAILWGRDAASVEVDLDGVAIIRSPHPSPLSAARGFFGSRPFSRANAALESQGALPIDWTLP